ncbi:MAG: hypothetical protein HC912_10100 [Saprospiraceae bacterium]|nr:hypothetical protein [Saprospiraceae bacterium]
MEKKIKSPKQHHTTAALRNAFRSARDTRAKRYVSLKALPHCRGCSLRLFSTTGTAQAPHVNYLKASSGGNRW